MMNTNMVSKNIRSLRRAWGQTQKELGTAIHIADSAISMYESGERFPSTEVLQLIASYYGISVDRLVSDDLSELDFKSLKFTWQSVVSAIEKILPIIAPSTNQIDPYFKRGYARINQIWDCIQRSNGIVLKSMCISAMDDFEKSFAEYATIESIANTLWLIFVLYYLLPDEQAVKLGEAIINGNGIKKDFPKKYLLKGESSTSVKDSKRKRRFASDQHDQIMELIKILKESPRYSELGDYYLALQYVLGIVDNENGEEINQLIGMAMMGAFLELDNPYVESFFEATLSQ